VTAGEHRIGLRFPEKRPKTPFRTVPNDGRTQLARGDDTESIAIERVGEGEYRHERRSNTSAASLDPDELRASAQTDLGSQAE
jgi:hypothetical protein